MPQPRVVGAPSILYRVGRSNDPLHYSTIRPEDARSGAGNRFDVPGGGVLYAATQREACFGETLARFRPSPAVRAVIEDDPGPYMNIGSVPQDWRLRRSISTIELDPPTRFLDVDAPETQAFLTNELKAYLAALGVGGPLDVSDIRSRDRLLTRVIAAYAFTASDDDGQFFYDGIAYKSRISDRWQNWAIFEGTDLQVVDELPIDKNDKDLKKVARMWDLTVH